MNNDWHNFYYLITKQKLILLITRKFLSVEVAMQYNDWNRVPLINASLDKWFRTCMKEDDIWQDDELTRVLSHRKESQSLSSLTFSRSERAE